MSATAAETPTHDKSGGKKNGGKGKLLMIVGGGLVSLLVGGWFSGIIPGLLGGANASAEKAANGQDDMAGSSDKVPTPPIFMDLPDIVTNLSNDGRRASFIKLRAKLQLATQEDAVIVKNNMPRVLDLFQGYLREVRPEELRGAAGTYRLREALLSRIAVAASPAHVTDVLFVELLVQ